jgi:hypothetical protein
MAVNRPTVAQLQEVARSLGIHLSDEHAATYHAMLQPNFDAYDLIDALPDFLPQVTYPRTNLAFRKARERTPATRLDFRPVRVGKIRLVVVIHLPMRQSGS